MSNFQRDIEGDLPPTRSGRSEQNRPVFHNRNRVFEVSGKASISSTNCPLIPLQFSPAHSSRYDRLDCDNQPVRQPAPAACFVIVRDTWFFVDRTPDTVSTEFSHNAEPASANFTFDFSSNFVDTVSNTSNFNGVVECTLSASN
jgi:hypothetical protein